MGNGAALKIETPWINYPQKIWQT